MSTTNTEPAFPVPDSHHADGQVQYGHNGMSLRDWFAGQYQVWRGDEGALLGYANSTLADMTGIQLPSPQTGQSLLLWELQVEARLKSLHADAMLAERNRRAQ
jgi:hypothetical protein